MVRGTGHVSTRFLAGIKVIDSEVELLLAAGLLEVTDRVIGDSIRATDTRNTQAFRPGA